MKLNITLPCICFTILSTGICLAQTSQPVTLQKKNVVESKEQQTTRELVKNSASSIKYQEANTITDVNGRKVNIDINGVQSLAVPEKNNVPEKKQK